ncbi:MAG: sigma-70 family RNA polymerase sigma factor [Planctomycetota bacterium]
MSVSDSGSTTNADQCQIDPWIARLRADDVTRDAAIAELREILLRGLSGPMSSRYGGGLQAEDVVQDALLKILDSLDQFAGRSRFTTWAMTIATRIGISEMRRKHYQDVSMEAFQGDDATKIEIAVDQSESADSAMDRQSMVQTLQGLIDSVLTEKQRFVIRASLGGLPVEVIAEKSGSNRNSVYKMVHDARSKLRSGLEAAGISADDLAAAL